MTPPLTAMPRRTPAVAVAALLALVTLACTELTAVDGVVLGPEAKLDGSFSLVDGDRRLGGDAAVDSLAEVADSLPDQMVTPEDAGDSDTADSEGTDSEDAGSEDAGSEETDSGTSADSTVGLDTATDAAAPATPTGCPPCPAGYSCFDAQINALPVCVPDGAFACAPCKSDLMCLGGVCSQEADGQFCRIPCAVGASGSSCPAGYSCDAAANGGAKLCQPSTGSCSCSPADLGQSVTCTTVNSFGSCSGQRLCTATGWSGCTAPLAGNESCNGLDDDCDGQVDEGLSGGACQAGSLGQCPGAINCLGKQGIICEATGQAEQCNGVDDDCDGNTDQGLSPSPCLGGKTGTCKGSTACQGALGWTCLPAIATETCNGLDDDCNGGTDEPFLVQGQYVSAEHCGNCGQPCAAAGPHLSAACLPGTTAPTCSLTCAPPWVDMDDNLADGCECQYLSAIDEPDGVDQNCDGIDGEVTNGIFVTKTGADGNPGTLALPVATLTKALELAALQSKRDVYTGGGVYGGSIDLVAGVSVYGGYGPGFTSRDPVLYQSAIAAVAPSQGPAWAVRCLGIQGAGAPTRLDGMTVLAANAKQPGQSSYGVLAIGCDARLQVTYCLVLGGDGATGVQGASGANGQGGLDAKAGKAAYDIGKTQCAAADANPGGAPGIRLCGDNEVSGGTGGTAVCPQMDEEGAAPLCPSKPYLQLPKAAELGKAGAGSGGGTGGASGADSYIDSNKGSVTLCKGSISCNTCLVPVMPRDGADGGVGQPGAQGGAGASGVAAKAGIVSSGLWQPIAAGDGEFGKPGSGGGGGGAAGGVEVHDCATATSQFTDIGGSGGGGGSGGCAGSGGKGGLGGGGSFAIFVVAGGATSPPVLWGCSLAAGNGGAGGNGGPAGSGGAGGSGGSGGASAEDQQKTFCTSKGGNGGYGGPGGHGGGGGGGAGGPSALIALYGFPKGSGSGLAKGNFLQVQGIGGTGGLGGPSIGAFGQEGAAGLAKAVMEIP